MDLDLKLKNETSRVNPAYKYIVEPTPENADLLDVKKNSLVTDSFANKRPFLTLFGHQNDIVGPIFEENFDVGIGENYDHCAAAIFHRIGVRVQVTAYAVQLLHWIARKYDIPTFASYVPNEAKEGAILFSFGSITDTTKITNYMRNSILKAFKRFPNVHFIWKLDRKTIKNQSELLESFPNVHAFEWIRQTGILAHPNLRAFISHCGQNSLTESVIAGVPVIGLPLFADQFYNADVAQKLGFGLQIDVNDLNGPNAEIILAETIEKVD
uniref:UDP-glucuronosyltransferase n=1 Tax=Meloidogyne javanica TaxID=6303 RepID=A0A915MBG7_MELJA